MPYSKKSKYKRNRQQQPDEFDTESFKTVPFSHTNYRGQKFKDWYEEGSGARAIVGRKKKSKKWGTQSILIPK